MCKKTPPEVANDDKAVETDLGSLKHIPLIFNSEMIHEAVNDRG